MKPYEWLPTSVDYDGRIYQLDLSYAAFFAAADALADEDLPPGLRLETALDIFVAEPHPVAPELLDAIIDLVKDDRPKPPPGPRTMDIEQDWPYICAAFQQAYGIDLYTDKTIHIVRFGALLQSIPKGTKLAEIIGIRAAEIPTPNKHNQKEIADLTRLKAFYALRGSKTSVQEGWANLFRILEARVKNA